MIEVTHSGSFANTEAFFRNMKNVSRRLRTGIALDKYGIRGVDALAAATPIDTSETSRHWDYEIFEDHGQITISWHNNHIVDGQVIAILIQYGHATGTGGYVVGRDYINPAMQPLFDEMAADIWKQVRR